MKYRPAYNIPVQGNARAYWRYAIKATIYMIRKSKPVTQKRQKEKIELCEIYRVEEINKYFLEANRPNDVILKI